MVKEYELIILGNKPVMMLHSVKGCHVLKRKRPRIGSVYSFGTNLVRQEKEKKGSSTF